MHSLDETAGDGSDLLAWKKFPLEMLTLVSSTEAGGGDEAGLDWGRGITRGRAWPGRCDGGLRKSLCRCMYRSRGSLEVHSNLGLEGFYFARRCAVLGMSLRKPLSEIPCTS